MRKTSLAFAIAGMIALPLGAIAAGGDKGMQDKPPAATGGTTGSGAAGGTTGAEGRPASPMFSQLDANSDNYIDNKESAKSATVQGNFTSMDKDGDGRISATEWSAFESGSK